MNILNIVRKAGVFLIIMAIVAGSAGALATPAEAAIADWQKGASIFPRWNTDFDSDSFRQSLRDLRATGANYVALIYPIYQANDQSSDMYAGGDTPTDASYISAINYAHSLGMKVVIKPHLGAQNGSGWRATISANDRNAWFTNYGNLLNKLGDIGKQTGAEGMCIGTELISMSTFTSNGGNTQRWVTMINNLRAHFPGFLTYSGNWGSGDFAEEVSHIAFWGSLDYIGISAYYPLAQWQNNPSVDALTASWDSWKNSKIAPIANQYGKKVIFTEIGYRSVDGAHNDPFDGGRGGGVNLQEQVNDYEALFSYWNNQSIVVGSYLWDWSSDPNGGGSGNNHYTPQNKPVLDVLKKWYSGTGTPPPPPPPPPPSGSFSATAAVSGNIVNNPVSINVKVTPSSQVSDAIVDVEVYDAANNKQFQKFFDHQTISSGQPGNYTMSWTPNSTGTYTLKVGVFNNNWSTSYYWNNSLTTIPIGTGGSGSGTGTSTGSTTQPNNPPPSGPSETNIWWPGDGVSVTGVQPFKAMLTNKSLSDYKMYWQVDGDRLNEMFDNQTDYPHKEVSVNLSGWTWKAAGPYQINFVSKDLSGNTISQKAVNIFVK